MQFTYVQLLYETHTVKILHYCKLVFKYQQQNVLLKKEKSKSSIYAAEWSLPEFYYDI